MKKIFLLVFFSFLAFNIANSSSLQKASWEINPSVLKASIETGENARLSFFVSNKGDPALFNVEKASADEFIQLNLEKFYLDSNSEQQVEAVLGNLSLREGVYVNSILVSNEETSSTLIVVLEIESHNPLFDISAQVFQPDLGTSSGKEINAEVNLHNLRSLNERAVVKYEILDFRGNSILKDAENVDVKNQIQFTMKFILPDNAEEGDYVLSIVAQQGDSIGTYSTIFSYPPNNLQNRGGLTWLLVAVIALSIVLILAFFVLNYYWGKKLKDNADYWSKHKKMSKKDYSFRNARNELEKLSYQKQLLEQAYNRGYITRNSYTAGNSKLNKVISNLKKRL